MLTAKILDLERRESKRGSATLRETSSVYMATDYGVDR